MNCHLSFDIGVDVVVVMTFSNVVTSFTNDTRYALNEKQQTF